jgi:hypothetical protein
VDKLGTALGGKVHIVYRAAFRKDALKKTLFYQQPRSDVLFYGILRNEVIDQQLAAFLAQPVDTAMR